MKQCDSLPDLSSALEYQKCLLSSCETWIGTSGWTERQKHLISACCYRFRMKAIHLLSINNNYIFSGVGIWNIILKNNTFLWRSVWFFGQPDTYRPTFPTLFQYLPAAKHLLSSVQCRWCHCRRAISSWCHGWTYSKLLTQQCFTKMSWCKFTGKKTALPRVTQSSGFNEV